MVPLAAELYDKHLDETNRCTFLLCVCAAHLQAIVGNLEIKAVAPDSEMIIKPVSGD